MPHQNRKVGRKIKNWTNSGNLLLDQITLSLHPIVHMYIHIYVCSYMYLFIQMSINP